MTWARDLSRDAAYSLIHNHFSIRPHPYIVRIALTSSTPPPLPNCSRSLHCQRPQLRSYRLSFGRGRGGGFSLDADEYETRCNLMNLLAYSELRSFIREETGSKGHGLLDVAWARSFRCDFSFNPRPREVIWPEARKVTRFGEKV